MGFIETGRSVTDWGERAATTPNMRKIMFFERSNLKTNSCRAQKPNQDIVKGHNLASI